MGNFKGNAVTFKDNSDKVVHQMADNVARALEAAGTEAEKYAKLELENDPRRIDTGLLRNSITHSLAGEGANISGYRSNATRSNGAKIENRAEGSYSGTSYSGLFNKNVVYVGTNVEYAPYVHEGTKRGMLPNRFLRNAIEKNAKQIRDIIKEYLK